MKRNTLLFLLFLSPIAAWSESYLDIFSNDLNECKRATALAFIDAFEDGNIVEMTGFLHQETAFDVEEITNYRKQLSDKINTGGMLIYKENKDTTYFKRVYFTYKNKERVYCGELSLHFEEDTPYVFKKIKSSTKAQLPRRLKRKLNELDQASKEEGRKLIENFKPIMPPSCTFVIGSRPNDQQVYLYNEYAVRPSSIKDAAPFNKSTLPIAIDIYVRDSCNFSLAFIQLKRLEKLDLNIWQVDHFPEELFDLQGLKILHLRIRKTDRFSIPSAIKKLQSLEELTIHCSESVGKLQLPEALTALNNLKRFKYSGEDIATLDASAIAVLKAVYNKPGMRIVE